MHRRRSRRDDQTPNTPNYSRNNANSLKQIDIRQIRRHSAHDRNKNDSNEGKVHVDGRRTVSRTGDSLAGGFCRGSGGRNVVGAKLGEKEREMNSKNSGAYIGGTLPSYWQQSLSMLTCLYLCSLVLRIVRLLILRRSPPAFWDPIVRLSLGTYTMDIVELSRLQFAHDGAVPFSVRAADAWAVHPARHHGDRLCDDRPRDLARHDAILGRCCSASISRWASPPASPWSSSSAPTGPTTRIMSATCSARRWPSKG